MKKFKGKYRIRSSRKKDFDYSTVGSYHVTICTRNFQKYFGKVTEYDRESDNFKVELNEVGEIAERYWKEIPNHFNNVMLDQFVVMPNHVHGIVILVENNGSSRDVALQRLYKYDGKFPKQSLISPTRGSLSTIVRSYKSACTKAINQLKSNSHFQWQPRYYDRIIRNEVEFKRIQKYIWENPIKWKYDKYNFGSKTC